MQKLMVRFTRKSSSLAILGASLFTLATTVAHAATAIPNPVQNVQDLQNVLCTLITYFFWIVITLSVIMILYAAFTYATARDDEEKTSKARRTITYAAIGIAVALIAIGFPNVVGSLFPNLNTTLNLQCSAFGG